MEKEFVSYEQALALKKLSFDDPCWFYYLDCIPGQPEYIDYEFSCFDGVVKKQIGKTDILCPIYQQAFRFFRENFGLWFVLQEWYKNHFNFIIYDNEDKGFLTGTYIFSSDDFKTYEEAQDACLDKLIELAKEDKQ